MKRPRPVWLWRHGDLVALFEKRVEAMAGKAMIGCMSPRMVVDLIEA
jgi:hypothetical protein